MWKKACEFSISIHAPREGGDCSRHTLQGEKHIFQSTPPARGATSHFGLVDSYTNISIHAPREGGDLSSPLGDLRNGYFNPRPPRGGRHRH